MNGTAMRHRPFSRAWRRVALGVAILMVGSLLQALALPAALADEFPEFEDQPPVPGSDAPGARPRPESHTVTAPEAPDAGWPRATAFDVPLNGGTSALPYLAGPTVRIIQPGAPQPAPVLRAGQEATVEIYGRRQAEAAGLTGVLFSIEKSADTPEAGFLAARVEPVDLEVDYSSFSHAYGGGYGPRLTLVALPACAVETPELAECRESAPVVASNDTERQVLTAEGITLREGEPVVLAAVAEEKGEEGDYTATELSPSASWDVDLNTGDMTWVYDMTTPAVPGGLAPTMSLSYSSGTIDGRTGGTNNQGSWVGDGFALSPAYIERRYASCSAEGVENADGNRIGDLCWDYDNAFITMDGAAGELVPDGEDTWRLPNDDGTVIERLTGTGRNNGARDDEHWRVTDPDGVQYYFGYQRLPGWSSGDETTDSTWTVPVFGDDTGDPCHASVMEDSWCSQAWRWNLDYVVDPHGNAMAYYYDKEENSYSRFLDQDANTRYTRGGLLDRVEYGLTSADMYTTPLAKVELTSGNRCLPGGGATCGDIDTHAQYYYDTPWDLDCDASEDCDAGRFSPSFWTTRRLTEVATFVHAGGTFKPVDSWAFNHRWGTADVDYQLLLASIRRTGHTASSPLTLPPVTFGYENLVNRLDETGDGYAPFVKARLKSIADESGGQINASYSDEACVAGSLPTPQSNTTRCFPQYLGNGPDQDPDLEWFNKYVVTDVTLTDRTGGAPNQVTRYDYRGDAAWHWTEDGLTPEDEKTWSQWRGYGHVRVTQGGQTSTSSQSDSYFLRGMHGDRATPSGGTKDVSVSLGSGEGDAITDHPELAGFQYRSLTFDGPGGKVLEKTVSRPWRHETARETYNWGTLRSTILNVSRTTTWTSLDQGAGAEWRITQQDHTYDTVAGRLLTTDDRGDLAVTDDDRCVRATYASGGTGGPLTLPSRVETVTVRCSATPDRSTDVVTDFRYAYDGNGYGAAPENGDLTATATLTDHDGTTATYLESGSTYDRYGRLLAQTDITADITVTGSSLVRVPRGDSRTTSMSYQPAAGFATSVTTRTPPAVAGDASTVQTTVTTTEPLRGQPVRSRDTNGRETHLAYDALGRSTKVWLPDRTTSQSPSLEYAYRFVDGAPVAVSTRTPGVDGSVDTSYVIYDGFLRPRQSQDPGPHGGRLLVDTFYDERGLVDHTYDLYFAEGTPRNTLFAPDDDVFVDAQTQYDYDGLGRAIESRLVNGKGDGSAVLGTTKTRYFGDRVTVLPPQGATATTTLLDAQGRTVELRQHHTRSFTSAYDTTRYSYSPHGELDTVTDTADNVWTFTYDQLGRQISSTDPDAGTSTSVYDDRNQLVERTDGRGETLAYRYDGLGRRIQMREGDSDGPLLTSWEFDTIPGAQGQLSFSTRYEGGGEYTNRVLEYDELYRPLASEVTIPDQEGALAGSYVSRTSYTNFDSPASMTFPAAGQLPELTVTPEYEAGTLRQTALHGDQGLYAASTYTRIGQLAQLTLMHDQRYDEHVLIRNEYEGGTRRLKESAASRFMAPGADRWAVYSYDEAGNVLSVSDMSNTGRDVQCFKYDYLRRMTEAWAQGQEGCASTPSESAMGGPAPYWHSYTYDQMGNRLTESLHEQDIQRTYDYPEPGAGQPHTLSTVVENAPGIQSLEEYGYDASGNTITRQIGGSTQTLDWNSENRLTSVEEADGTRTEYLYDAEGNRLIGRTATETTLYLGHTEVRVPTGSQTALATRYLDAGDGNMVVFENDGTLYYTLADHHGTGQYAVDAYTLDIAHRRTLPFGETRGDEPAFWPGTRGFVGGTIDTSTGLTHLSAREYDPAIGRFVSIDPIMDLTDPQQIHGYSYSNGNPLTFSDPSGLLALPKIVLSIAKKIVSRVKAVGRSISLPGSTRRPSNTGGSTVALRTSSDNDEDTMFGMSPEETAEARELWGGIDNSWSWDIPGLEEALDVVDPLGIGISGLIDDVGTAINCVTGDASALECAILVGSIVPIGRVARGIYRGVKAARRANRVIRNLLDDAKEAIGRKPKDSGNSTPSCRTPNSFLPGTMILLADGSAKPIEDIEIGDKVLATDPVTGETSARTVTAEVFNEGRKDLVTLTIETEAGTAATVTSTDEHPFWVENLGQWIDAEDLRFGQLVRTTGRTSAVITGIDHHTTPRAEVHNLTIEGLHTYYVLAGQTPVLVHNAGGDSCWSTSARMRAAGPGGEFGLPNQGRIRYVPPEGYNPANPLPRGPNNGYIDRFGNEWTVGPSRTEGHPFEWDVQLSRTGREQLGWLSRDGSHVNVDPFGEVTHR